MTATIISNMATFGQMTNTSVSRLIGLNTTLLRLKEAVATASSGYDGVPGTQFEAPAGSMTPTTSPNNFGVQPDPDEPGARGTDYAYAVNALTEQWQTFWTAAAPYIEQLDNGTGTL
jgi:hypothetical protein